MPPKPKFAEGERVLCFHGPLIYEAKAIRINKVTDKSIRYLIHYAGWNKNWDEWVPENRVLKYNDANVQRQKEVSKSHANVAKNHKKGPPKSKKNDVLGSSSSSSSGGGGDSRDPTPTKEAATTTAPAGATATSSRSRSTAAKATPTETTTLDNDTSNTNHQQSTQPSQQLQVSEMPRKKRYRGDASIETADEYLSKIEVKIKMPEELKPWLVDDWEAINKQHKVIELPAKPTVQEIVDAYVLYKKTNKTLSKEMAINDVGSGLIEYFNVMLGTQLLYKFERPQYIDVLAQHPRTSMVNLYGAFHLLRLFVKLGSALAFSSLDEKSVQLLLIHLNDFLKYLVKNGTLFNMQQFVSVTPEYLRRVEQFNN